MGDGRYQMLWDCPACETPKLLGLDHRHCPSCGHAQDPARRYYPPEGEEVAVEDHPFHGADLRCPACDSPNAAVAHNCVNCGSGLDEGGAVGVRSELDAGLSDDAKAARADFEAQSGGGASAAASPPPPAAKKRGGKGCLVALLLLALIGVAVVVALTWKTELSLVTTGHRWERSVEIETFQATSSSAWRDAVPARAYDIRCQREVRRHESVKDGEDCKTVRKDLGDGTFKKVQKCTPRYRKEPVYGEKCRYTVDAWVTERTARAQGASLDDAPRWPEVKLRQTGTCKGCEREGSRRGGYFVDFLDEASKETKSCELPEARWRQIAVGSRWRSKVGVLTGALDCDQLEAM